MHIAAHILAGGRSSRFGQDKALHIYQGRSLLERCLDTAAPLFPTMDIIAKDPSQYNHLGYPVLSDVSETYSPFSGLITGLRQGESSWHYFQACDMPFLDTGSVRRLLDTLERNKVPALQAIVPKTPGGIQPLAACYHQNTLAEAEKALETDSSLKLWLQGLRVNFVHFTREQHFRNVNTREDLHVSSRI